MVRSWSRAVQAQTDCSSYPRGMPCTMQGAMPEQKNQKSPAPWPQSDREPRGPRLKTHTHRAKRARHATQSKDRREGRRDSHKEHVSGTRQARAAPPGQPAGAGNTGRGPLHDTGDPVGRGHARGPVHHNTVRHIAQERVPVPRGNPEGRERNETSPDVRHQLRSN